MHNVLVIKYHLNDFYLTVDGCSLQISDVPIKSQGYTNFTRIQAHLRQRGGTYTYNPLVPRPAGPCNLPALRMAPFADPESIN